MIRQKSFSRPTGAMHKQRGVTLVELMVGITIGLLVSIAAVGTLIYNRVATTTVSDTVRLQQDAATVMRVIGRQLKQAGAVPVVESGFGKFKYLGTYSGIAGVIPVAASPVSVSGTNGAPDELTVSYSVSPNGAAGVSNCFGQTPDATATNITSIFQVLAGAFRCATPVTGAAAAQNQPFLDNVEDLQFWYAVRVAGVTPSQLQYRAANTVADWTAVEAVQVCVRMTGTTANNATGGQVTVGCNNENIADDGRIRRVFRQVFTLRNLQSLS
ncbi:PilW family protein [Hydrogenophaga sp. PAMC20947]|uniref:PilW family protein n=1 Tax=Hydrogenophaga sp. PAMC20947 TaxID=2565558 RepID=UPI00109E00C8|nr:PilW family protein [Hydrogenophaga sp. PAMC20947]QCB45038.1 prepilin-type N-terminal cleavage/methylation domain-containing protein [Hydrogenophaga sp. PAMC20947]